jgi:hypothetical protein
MPFEADAILGEKRTLNRIQIAILLRGPLVQRQGVSFRP